MGLPTFQSERTSAPNMYCLAASEPVRAFHTSDRGASMVIALVAIKSSVIGIGTSRWMWILPTRHPATGTSRINPSGPYEVVCRHDLPPVATFHPGVGEPIAMLEFTIRAASSYDQPACHHCRRRPIAVHDHRVVARDHHRVRPPHDRI